jgi:hypothetical protein
MEGPGPTRARRLARPLFDSLLIVFGVVLGFVVNDWAQGRAQRTRTAQALAAIRQELTVNRAGYAWAHAHHVRVRDTLAAYAARREPVRERVYHGGIFNPSRPVTAASARTTGVLAGLPYDLVLVLSEAYDSQQYYWTLSQGIVQSVYADGLRRGNSVVFRGQARSDNFGLLANDWAQREASLVAACDSATARIDRVQGGSRARSP